MCFVLQVQGATKDHVSLEKLGSLLKLGLELVSSNCLASSGNLPYQLFQVTQGSVRIIVPSNKPVSCWTSTNFAPLHHANTASILVVKNGNSKEKCESH
jgi:hypothetical protein